MTILEGKVGGLAGGLSVAGWDPRCDVVDAVGYSELQEGGFEQLGRTWPGADEGSLVGAIVLQRSVRARLFAWSSVCTVDASA